MDRRRVIGSEAEDLLRRAAATTALPKQADRAVFNDYLLAVERLELGWGSWSTG
jgi:hypothetical protein